MLSVDDGSFEDGHGDVYTFTKSTVDDLAIRKKVNLLRFLLKKDLHLQELLKLQNLKNIFSILKNQEEDMDLRKLLRD